MIGAVQRRSHVELVSPRARRLGEARRDELVERIQEVVLEHGFAKLTVDELAARLQCSKSTLYSVSSSKESLVATAIRGFLSSLVVAVETRLDGVSDPVLRLEAYLAGLGAEMQRMSQDCFLDMGANDLTREIYLEHSAVIKGRIAELIRDGMACGSFRDVDADFVAESVSLLIDGIQWGRLLEGADVSRSDAYHAVSDLTLAALGRA